MPSVSVKLSTPSVIRASRSARTVKVLGVNQAAATSVNLTADSFTLTDNALSILQTEEEFISGGGPDVSDLAREAHWEALRLAIYDYYRIT